jgi:hypothetical protein
VQDVPSQDVDAIDWIERQLLRAIESGDRVTPSALLFLLRRYPASPRRDLAARLEVALAVALQEQANAASTLDRAAWLMMFADAAQLSSDERIADVMVSLVDRLSADWTMDSDVERAAASIEACLRAADLVDRPVVVTRAVDELERIVSIAYKPGHTVGGAAAGVRLASALLIAFAASGRLPYAMLAEELIQTTRRTAWDGDAGRFLATFEVNCEAVRVLSRLTTLHANVEYQRVAVLAPNAGYDRDADRILCALRPQLEAGAGDCALYGLALIERLSR